jgi:protoheme IX farnesyltransferase
MSSKLLLPRLNCASNFNFFFTNTKKKLAIEQNFIGNQFLALLRKRKYAARYSTDAALKSVATKVLNCHDDVRGSDGQPRDAAGAAGAGAPAAAHGTHIPFRVTTAPRRRRPAPPAGAAAAIAPYLTLCKPRLTMLVTLSLICLYALSPYAVTVPELALLMAGTAMCLGAANAINMAREPDFDRNMPRTAARPIVTGVLTPPQAYRFAAATGAVGCALLYFGVNPVVAALGLTNIVLYAWIYTSLKRRSIINTWVGALVGAIPPLMGWAALLSLTHPGVWCLAALLYAWQFPHFNALSHNIASQYKEAGYVMTAAENPKLNARVALRYLVLMFPLCLGLSYFGVTDWVFPLDSAVVNAYMTYWAYKFWQQQRQNYSASGAARNGPTADGMALANMYAKKTFWSSVWHLPVVLILAMLHKKGQWERLLDYLGFSRDKKLA